MIDLKKDAEHTNKNGNQPISDSRNLIAKEKDNSKKENDWVVLLCGAITIIVLVLYFIMVLS